MDELYRLSKSELIERLVALESAQQSRVAEDNNPPRTNVPLPQRRSFVAAVLNTVGALVIVLDRQGQIIYFNRACVQLTGYSFAELESMSVWDLLLPEEIEGVKHAFDELCSGTFQRRHENYWVGRDGGLHLIDWTNTVLTGPDGVVEHLIGTGIDITERRQIENARRTLLTQVESTFENAAIGMAHTSPDGRWLRVNQKLCEIFGYSHKELLSQSILDIVHPEDVATSREKESQLLEGTITSLTMERRFIRKNGEIVWASFTNSLVRDSAGNPDYLICCIADISRRKRAEVAVLESEARLQAIINQANAIIFLKDREGHRLMVNQEYLNRFGYKNREDVLGKKDFELYPREIAEQFRANDLKVWATGNPFAVEEMVHQPDGLHTYISKKFLITDKEGEPYALCGIGTDITSNKNAEDSARKSEEHLRRVLNNLYIFVGLLGPDGVLLDANQAPLDAAGLTLGDVRGKKFWDCYWWNYSQEVQNQLREAFERALNGESSRYDVEVRVAGGRMMAIDFMLAPLRNGRGEITHIIPSAVDVTARKQLERELLEVSSREQRRIGQDLHDDLCQRLTATELLLHTLTLDLQARNAPETEKANKVAAYIRGAIAHTRLLARGLVPVSVTTDGLITALRELAVNSEEMYCIRCEFICPTPVQFTDTEVATHLYRIAQECISNAVRHGKATEVSLVLELQDTRVRLLVQDNGCGIPYPLPRCTGMGLRIMEYRAGMIGATLEIHPGQNGGTSIACTFPLKL